MTRANKRLDPKKRAQEVLAELNITARPCGGRDIAQKKGIRTLRAAQRGSFRHHFYEGGHRYHREFVASPEPATLYLGHELGHFEMHLKEIGSEVHVDKKFLAFARNESRQWGGIERKSKLISLRLNCWSRNASSFRSCVGELSMSKMRIWSQNWRANSRSVVR